MRLHAINAEAESELPERKRKGPLKAGHLGLTANPAGPVLPAPSGYPFPIALGRAALHINFADRALIIDRRALLDVDRRRGRRRCPIDHRRLRLGDCRSNGSADGKTSQGPECHGGTGRQAITRCSRLGGSQAGDQRQSRGCTGNKMEDLHDHHLRQEGGHMPSPSCHEIYCSKPL
jgi:hypothetical protein